MISRPAKTAIINAPTVASSDQLSLTTARKVQKIEFDVAVVVNETATTAAGGGITIASIFNVKGEHSEAAESATTSKIKFTIPIALPVHQSKEPTPKPQANQKDYMPTQSQSWQG